MNIPQYILQRTIRRQSARLVRFPHWEHVHSILLIYESDLLERNREVQQIRDWLLEQQKDVVLLGYCPKRDITSAVLPQSRIVGQRSFLPWICCPYQDLKEDLKRQSFDLLIDLTTQPLLPLHYLSLTVNARFKAGLLFEQGIHDLLIESHEPLTQVQLFKQIVHYLTQIKSND